MNDTLHDNEELLDLEDENSGVGESAPEEEITEEEHDDEEPTEETVQETDEDDSDEESEAPDGETAEQRRERNRKWRQERSERRRIAKERDHSLIKAMADEIKQLREKVGSVEVSTIRQSVALIDSDMEKTNDLIYEAQRYYERAAEEGDGKKMMKAQKVLTDAENRLQYLANVKEQAIERAKAPQPKVVSPIIKSNYEKWTSKNSWYDPALKNEDSRIARIIDDQLVKEGYHPEDPGYWDELDSRLSRRLPHRYSTKPRTETRAAYEAPRPKSAPKGVVSANSTTVPGPKGSFVLSKERAALMSELGLRKGTKEYSEQVEYFRKYDRERANEQ